MISYHVAMTLFIAIYVIFNNFSFELFHVENQKLLDNITAITYESILLLNAFLLAYAAYRIRRTLKSLRNAFLNENFIRVHLVNSVVYAVLYLGLGVAVF